MPVRLNSIIHWCRCCTRKKVLYTGEVLTLVRVLNTIKENVVHVKRSRTHAKVLYSDKRIAAVHVELLTREQ